MTGGPAPGGRPRRVVIAGGGVSGLSAALFLQDLAREAERSVRITLLESADRPGGALSTVRDGEFLLEEGADSFVRTKPAALRLCERLGLADALLPTRPAGGRTLIVRNGRLLPIPEGINLFVPTSLGSMITTPIFSWPGKLRMGLDLLLPRGRAADGGDESVGAFIRRRLGREALERLAQPMIAGIWAGDPDTLSLRSTLPQLADMEREHRSLILAMKARMGAAAAEASGARYGLFLTLRRGMQQLVDAISRELPAGIVLTRSAVTGLQATSAGPPFRVTAAGRTHEADGVILALPPAASARLLAPVDPALAAELDAIPASSTATINFVFRREDVSFPIEGFGFVSPAVEERSLMACTFTSRKYEGRCGDDHVILRTFTGGAAGARWLAMSDGELIAAARKDLAELLGIRAEPVLGRLCRHDGLLPQYLTGHLDRVARIESLLTSRPGLSLAGNAFRGVGISDCVESARKAAENVFASLYDD